MNAKDIAVQIEGLVFAADALVYELGTKLTGDNRTNKDYAGLIVVIDCLAEKSKTLKLCVETE